MRFIGFPDKIIEWKIRQVKKKGEKKITIHLVNVICYFIDEIDE